ncbi:hypothetical protein [Rhizobium jaguaris]|uniref:hypothetical protein n=1 Tax=Rhizobium jaguaris TaxID=1312183 RepID=UPI001FE17324|nr:hypothetical protein [Rhizobium jaguaris]
MPNKYAPAGGKPLPPVSLHRGKNTVLQVWLLTKELEGFVAEDAAMLHAGLVSSSYVIVVDTGARHSHIPSYATNIGGPNFTVFRIPKSKSRVNFLSLPHGGCQDIGVSNHALCGFMPNVFCKC